jgi:hypothetical protein
MKTELTFARRRIGNETHYQYIAAGTIGIADPKDSIFLTVHGPTSVVPPAERLTDLQMKEWLGTLRSQGSEIRAVDGANIPLDISLDD